ncbi:ABC transporter ATP-binding protein [Kitasatospora sp. GP82]|uniref:ABC transporter ATP-binding protein n=1 Tax=Kitasatospora sp. GP82 TaxID=3035089 RepID=UPI002476966A|nr:ABC transporter ATP-binding protein [Kitasatospora sp. GP82]MDH6127752.1 ABC-2 type transport system ATP-binding protein [Kitasatospora sp. GP82]
MIQITGLTKVYRRGRPPALLDLTFDARPGMVTALLGAEGAGKTTALRLMVELERGTGITLFDGRTYRRLRRPEREVGVVLPGGRVPAGHPGRRARSHLQMLAAAVGVPSTRADELLEQTRLATVSAHRLRSFSPGMHRRLTLAAALLGSPHTLLLDAPTEGLSPRNVEWFHSFLRSFAVSGGTVLVTTRTPQEASVLADRVITLDQGRLLADQPIAEFRRTRMHPEVSVRGPQMARLADLLAGQGVQIRRDGGAGLAVSGIGRTEIGELAYRHGILLHELADRVVEQPIPHPSLPSASGRSGSVQLHSTGRSSGAPLVGAQAVGRQPVGSRALGKRPTSAQSAPQSQLQHQSQAHSYGEPQPADEVYGVYRINEFHEADKADAPDNPDMPDTPDTPEAPDTPGTPDMPGMADTARLATVGRPAQPDRTAPPPAVSVPSPGPVPESAALSQPLPGLDHHRSE